MHIRSVDMETNYEAFNLKIMTVRRKVLQNHKAHKVTLTLTYSMFALLAA